jgi:hypothetical protein
MTPQEQAAANHIRSTFSDGVRPGQLFIAIDALHALRDGINHRDELIEQIRSRVEFSLQIGSHETGMRHIEELLEAFTKRGNK